MRLSGGLVLALGMIVDLGLLSGEFEPRRSLCRL